MRISIIKSHHPRRIIVLGVSGTALFGCLLLLLLYLTTSMSPEEAKKRVRLCILRDISQRHMTVLKEKGLRVPDLEMARQWKEEIDRANHLVFVAVKVKRPFLDILLGAETPTHLARVVFRVIVFLS